DFATVDALSNGRAEIMAGRGSFTESFPLFGYDLRDYHELFEEKLELLLKIRKNNKEVHWKGSHRASINGLGVYPNPVQNPLPVWLGSGGNQESVIRAANLGLPVTLAIIGGNPLYFAPLVKLYKETLTKNGYKQLPVASHSHGFIWDTDEEADNLFYPSTELVMNRIGRERGWPPYTRHSFEEAKKLEGALYVGNAEYVAEKIIMLNKNVGINRFFLHLPLGTMPHDQVMRAIELLGEKVAPIVREKTK
ncbi:MAG: LLM class flavin-dependent oxidoreductase, partial [Defluviitaleaceae bacterium]|nr:LLM class flavin-dependent oxidoreductase [Defluviitaleaceae bacterium]